MAIRGRLALCLMLAIPVVVVTVVLVTLQPRVALAQSAPTDSEILTKGDPEAAIRQLHQLWNALKAQDFERKITPQIFALLDLQDESLSPKRSYRSERTVSVTLPVVPEYGDVLFFTDLYVDPRVKRGPGDLAIPSPAGFFIVGWRDGRIEKVPIEDIRMLSLGGKQIYCFPGMPQYREDLPRHLYVDAAGRAQRT